jgi:hypothetical protein
LAKTTSQEPTRDPKTPGKVAHTWKVVGCMIIRLFREVEHRKRPQGENHRFWDNSECWTE